MVKIPDIKSMDDLRAIIRDLPGPDDEAAKRAAAREPQLTKPQGSLGRLEEISKWLSTWQGRHPPMMDNPRAYIYAANHGVAARGVSAFPAEVTKQMVANFLHGGAAINQICETFGIQLMVDEMLLDEPTEDFTRAPAMTETAFIDAVRFGMSNLDDPTDVLCLGEMGIANTTAAAAVCHALFGDTASLWTGPGTGVEGDVMGRKIAVVAEAVILHKAAMIDGLEVLRCVGGREMAAIAGMVVAARLNNVPVMLDGYVCTAAAAALEAFRPGTLDHCMVGHASSEPGHRHLMERIGKRPLLELDMRLGEGSGAALAVGLLRAAVNC
ncbi:MAG: nicotinate-nucleotide--dimethylbenzimidazole phosphoribosyltransferase, partial [Rhodospirillales bacterium]|nr:nicotinate-nucleotide--dimethylbenzimidazole phosphoribosyltransferase [Rhodospirillales bacterium]